MARLLASLGTSAGVVYESLLNLERGSYDAPRAAPQKIEEVVVLATGDPRVKQAACILKLLLKFNDLLSSGKRLPLTPSIRIRYVGVTDVASRSDAQVFYSVCRDEAPRADFVDITGGRAAMGVLLAVAAREAGKAILATMISPTAYNRSNMAQVSLGQLDVCRLAEEAERNLEHVRETILGGHWYLKLDEIVTGQATTIQLYP